MRLAEYFHDPSTIVTCDGEHWCFSTGLGIHSHHSLTLSNWMAGPRVFEEPPAWTQTAVPGSSAKFWAPDIIRMHGMYFLYYAVSTWGSRVSAIGLATNPTLNPLDERNHWTDQGPVIQSSRTDNFNAIDPSVFADTDGRLWLAFGSYWTGIKLIELDPLTGLRKAGTPLTPLAQRAPGGDTSIEAACLTRHGGWYYLFTDWGQCCRGTNSTYEIRLGRSRTLAGPYLDRDGKKLLDGGGSLFLGSSGKYIGPGHAGIFSEPGQDWFSFHYYDADRRGLASFAVRKLAWDNAGWPVLGGFAP
jgi:arabinan endo-1,5-alpha-L-arabinosidase